MLQVKVRLNQLRLIQVALAEVKIEEGEGEVLNEDKYEWDFTCIKMPENLEEENDD